MLTPEQLPQLKAAILADNNLTADVAAGNIGNIVNYLKGDSTFIVSRNITPTADILNAIVGANLTPTDAPDDTQLFENRAMVCQGKQNSLMILLQGQASVNTGKPNIRSWLQDALTGLPSGTNGATMNAGWTNVKTAISRAANKFEKIWATGTGTSGTPGQLVVEGIPSIDNVVDALAGV